MSKTISIDSIAISRITLQKDSTGTVSVYAEYGLVSGANVISQVNRQVSTTLTAARKLAAQALLDGIAQDIASVELT
jgi:hypothetical protein